MANKKRGKSKSRGNNKFRKRKTIKMNRKYVKRRSRRKGRNKRQKGGNPLLNMFGFKKKKEDVPTEQVNPLLMQEKNVPQPVKKTNMVMGQINKLKTMGQDAQKKAENALGEMKAMIPNTGANSELHPKLQEVSNGLKKMGKQIAMMDDWIMKGRSDNKCPCCSQKLSDPQPKGKGLEQQMLPKSMENNNQNNSMTVGELQEAAMKQNITSQ